MPSEDAMGRVPLHPRLSETVAARIDEFGQIDEQRESSLREMASYVRERIASGEDAHLIFICTHNSRRSHMAQIWAQTAAAYYNVPGVETFSGGTEATAFNLRAVAALERAGFSIEAGSQGSNPVYRVRYGDTSDTMEALSKVYDQPPNPTTDFAAVMTCSHADAACPLVIGATKRIAITYEDPKAFDGTDRETDAYDERCRQIAREMLFVFSQEKC